MLDALPVEVLQQITSHLEGVHIGLIWICGNTRLNYRLGGRGVLHFRFVVDPLFSSTWPSMIRHFELDSFIVEHRFSKYSKALSWSPSFSDLRGSKLGVLKLSSNADMDAFCAHLDSSPDAYPCLEHISVCKLDDVDRNRHPYRLPSLLRALPLIQSLPGLHLDVLVPSDLPRNLKHLEVEFDTFSGGYSFPDGLETLHLEPLCTTEPAVNIWPILSNLPLGLQSLCVYVDDNVFTHPSVSDIALLPRRLKDLRLNFVDPQAFSTLLLSALPPRLEVLKLFNLEVNDEFWQREDYAAVKALPRTLTMFRSGNSTLPADAAPWFPPSLTWIQPLPHLTAKELNSFLPNLRELYLCLPAEATAVLDLVQLHALPLGLKKLIVDVAPEALPLSSPAENLPPNLLELTFWGTSVPIGCLPMRLVLLQIGHSNTWSLTPTDCESLPRTLTSLLLGRVDIQSATDAMSRLPPHLQRLHIHAAKLEVGCLKTLPSSKLRSLRLEYSEDDTGLLALDICLSLPRQIAICDLCPGGSDRRSVTDETLMNLPPGLLSLTISRIDCSAFSGTCKHYLPKHLTYLELGGQHPDWFEPNE